MRADALGLFWQDLPPEPKQKKEKYKPTPPDRVWESPDHLPNLEVARQLKLDVYSGPELWHARGERVIFDIEVYPNYFLCGFRSLKTGRIVAMAELHDGMWSDDYAIEKMQWVAENCTLVGFNSYSFDVPVLSLACSGKATNANLMELTTAIIVLQERASDVLKRMKVKKLKPDHIDLIEVAPLSASLKKYAGRLHAQRMQDLPFVPGTALSDDQVCILRWYWVNDLVNTQLVHDELTEQLSLRETMSAEYSTDLRSKSDAQVAEAVIAHEVTRLLGQRPQKPQVYPGTVYKYRVPHFIRFQSDLLNWTLWTITNANFIVSEYGNVGMPDELKVLKLPIDGSVYRMGIGGLHSSEEKAAHVSDDEYELIDVDMTSFYPYIILLLGLFPPHIGPVFLQVYQSLVDRRVGAKRNGLKVIADSLKIVINGSFGKLGSPYSILYAPDLLIQVTITGQLTLLMLIERLILAGVGISVVSANTDGIVIKCPKRARDVMDSIVKQFERDTGFETEDTRYLALYSRDVNNYIAVKRKFDKATKTWTNEPDGVKTKGAYANPWSDPKLAIFRFHKNPVTTVCVEAVERLLVEGVPITRTIRECTDVRKFVAVRDVKGGAVKVWSRKPAPGHEHKEDLLRMAEFEEVSPGIWKVDEDALGDTHAPTTEAYERALDVLCGYDRIDYLGKVIRWYYAQHVDGTIIYASSGNKVPRSEGAMPLMDLPTEIPADLDFDWYINECESMLRDIGYST